MRLAPVSVCGIALMLCAGMLSAAERTIDDFSAPGRADARHVRIAAADSTAEARAAADFACTDPAKRIWRDAMGNVVDNP